MPLLVVAVTVVLAPLLLLPPLLLLYLAEEQAGVWVADGLREVVVRWQEDEA